MTVDPSVTIFDELRPGDVVAVRHVESVVVQVRPGATPSDVQDTTEAARQAGAALIVVAGPWRRP